MKPGTRQAGPMPAPPSGPATLNVLALLAGAQSVLIEHQGVLYKLQITRQGGLLLTKN